MLCKPFILLLFRYLDKFNIMQVRSWRSRLFWIPTVYKVTLECALDGAQSQIPTLKFLNPQHPKSHPLGMTQATEWKFSLICFISLICENTHKVCYKHLWNWLCNWNQMIFDLLTSPKGHQFDPGWKFYLHPVCLIIPVNLICNMTMLKKKKFGPLPTPAAPKSHPRGMTQASEQKSYFIRFIPFICKNTQKVWNKILWNWLLLSVIET